MDGLHLGLLARDAPNLVLRLRVRQQVKVDAGRRPVVHGGEIRDAGRDGNVELALAPKPAEHLRRDRVDRDDHVGLGEERPCQRDELSLTEREREPAVRDDGVEPAGDRRDARVVAQEQRRVRKIRIDGHPRPPVPLRGIGELRSDLGERERERARNLVGKRAGRKVVPLADARREDQDARHAPSVLYEGEPASTPRTFSISCPGVNGFWMNGPSAPASV